MIKKPTIRATRPNMPLVTTPPPLSTFDKPTVYSTTKSTHKLCKAQQSTQKKRKHADGQLASEAETVQHDETVNQETVFSHLPSTSSSITDLTNASLPENASSITHASLVSDVPVESDAISKGGFTPKADNPSSINTELQSQPNSSVDPDALYEYYKKISDTMHARFFTSKVAEQCIENNDDHDSDVELISDTDPIRSRNRSLA